MSLGDTLFGYVGDFLYWCGQADIPGKTMSAMLSIYL